MAQPPRIFVRRIITPGQSEARARERMRGVLAVMLACLLIIEVIAGVIAMLCPDIVHDEAAVGAVKDLLTIVLGPTVALVGAATGFYYGTKPPT